jgi:sigma-B regulation protein RsbQ
MKSTDNNKLILDYKTAGKGNTTLVFVHGAFIDKEYWNAQMEYFGSNYKVVSIDLAGHGKSGKNRNDWSIQALGEDVVTLIKELGLTNVILIGHSLGGDVILEVAIKIPQLILGFVGIDNFKNAGTELSEQIQKQIDSILQNLKQDFSNTSEMFARQALLTAATNKEITERIIHDYRNFDKRIGVEIISSSFSFYLRERELLQQLKLKLYLINVDYFPINEEPLKKYPASGYEILNIHGSCHYPMIESPDVFNSILSEIIGNRILKVIA